MLSEVGLIKENVVVLEKKTSQMDELTFDLELKQREI